MRAWNKRNWISTVAENNNTSIDKYLYTIDYSTAIFRGDIMMSPSMFLTSSTKSPWPLIDEDEDANKQKFALGRGCSRHQSLVLSRVLLMRTVDVTSSVKTTKRKKKDEKRGITYTIRAEFFFFYFLACVDQSLTGDCWLNLRHRECSA